MLTNLIYKFDADSLDQVLNKGSGIAVIYDFLHKFLDTGSTLSYNSNFSATSYRSNLSTRSVGRQSLGGGSLINMHDYVKRNKLPLREAASNIDKMLEIMLSPPNENVENQQNFHQQMMQQQAEIDERPPENPEYREYLELYLVVRKRVCNAKVLSFNGEIKIYQPFKGKINDEVHEHKVDDVNIPSNVYRLLGVGILSTFLPSAILGGHLIDTTPSIDSNELERSMNCLLPLRQKVLNIFQHGFGTSNSVSLQRWFQPNRDKELKYDIDWANEWVQKFKILLHIVLNDDQLRSQSPTLLTPLKVLLAKPTSFASDFGQICTENFELPQIKDISQLLTAAYCGTLITLNYIRDNCSLSNVAKSLAKINKFEFETVLAIEMLQKEDLTEKVFTLIDENSKIFQIDSLSSAKYRNSEINHRIITRRRTLRLLTRICSLLPMRPFIDGQNGWKSKLSHSLAAFNHVTTTYHHGIKNCIESAITWLYCNIEKQGIKNENLTSERFLRTLSLSLKQLPPEPCSGMGVLIQEFIMNFAELNWNNISKDSTDYKSKLMIHQLKLLKDTFPVFSRLRLAITCCVQFFYQICTLVKELGDYKILMESTVAQFQDAYEFLRELGIWDAVYLMEINPLLSNDKIDKCTSGFIRRSIDSDIYVSWPLELSKLIFCFGRL